MKSIQTKYIEEVELHITVHMRRIDPCLLPAEVIDAAVQSLYERSVKSTRTAAANTGKKGASKNENEKLDLEKLEKEVAEEEEEDLKVNLSVEVNALNTPQSKKRIIYFLL
jgi:hypothetical protein